jgi:membrane protein YdbS with pleckstrin-like domain
MHARLGWAPSGGLTIEDLGSANGTFVDGRRVTTIEALHPGAVIQVGTSALRVDGAMPAGRDNGATMLLTPAMAAAQGWPSPEPTPSAVPPAELIEHAKALIGEGKLPEAESVFRQLIDSGQELGEAFYGAGFVRLQMGDVNAAEQLFHSAVTEDPRQTNALYQLGVIAEKRSAPEQAVGLYERALAINPDHAGAKARLSVLRPPPPPVAAVAASTVSATVASSPTAETGSIPLGPDNEFGVYEFLLQDKTPLSQQTVELMSSLHISRRASVIARAGKSLPRLLLLVGIVVALIVGGPHLSTALRIDNVSSNPPSRSTWVIVAVAVCLAALLIMVARALTTHYTLARGRLQIEKGLFRRHVTNLELWRIQTIELEQSVLNRLTGDGTLRFTIHRDMTAIPRSRTSRENKPLSVTGLAKGKELDDLFQQLLNLVFLLRSNPAVKGIYQ